ncbi:hypothetical protein ATANTOWER_004813 [Ataeniobius toweri]|uniref:Uncharacterized protein n=1 Tax=Ataeniobius toweri TaxID=208326 RepID=A0ABU7AUC5_9TELE|nr:hypothetical protein [Ataeniobius toweri]
MSSIFRRPTLTRLLFIKAVQQNQRLTIYSKPPKEKIGPVKEERLKYLPECSLEPSYSSPSLPCVCLLSLSWPRLDGFCIMSQNTGKDQLHISDIWKRLRIQINI